MKSNQPTNQLWVVNFMALQADLFAEIHFGTGVIWIGVWMVSQPAL